MAYKKEAPKKLDNVLVISNTAIGDTLFATPAIRALKQNLPNAKITALLNPNNFELFETNPNIDEMLLYDGRWRGFLAIVNEIKKKCFDVAIIFHSNEPQATPLCALAGIKTIIKVPNQKNRFNFAHFNPPTPALLDKHGIFDRLKSLEFIGIFTDDPRMDIFLKDEWKAKVDEFLPKDKLLIGFQIGASTLSRQWFKERWFELGWMVLEKYPESVILLLGSPAEKNLTKPIKEAFETDRVIDCAGIFRLGEAAVLISRLNVMITPDTGPLHIAASFSVPTVTLFVVADPKKSNPPYNSSKHLYIKKPKTCEPCIAKRCKYQKCMRQIEAIEVIEKMERLIK